jgi:hypothetical protein
MAGDRGPEEEGARRWIARTFTHVEDIVYVGLGVLLALCALTLLVEGGVLFTRSVIGGGLHEKIVDLLDQFLLILMIVEILYTVQVSFRAHTLVPEPFLLVGLIAVTRRNRGGPVFRDAMLEIALLTLMILALVASLLLLRRRGAPTGADRA